MILSAIYSSSGRWRDLWSTGQRKISERVGQAHLLLTTSIASGLVSSLCLLRSRSDDAPERPTPTPAWSDSYSWVEDTNTLSSPLSRLARIRGTGMPREQGLTMEANNASEIKECFEFQFPR